MAYEQVRDVLKTVHAIHNGLAQICEGLSERTDDERLKLLMEIVQQHEKRFSVVLNRYEGDTAERILNTWLQYAPTAEIQSALQTAQLTDVNSVAEIAEQLWIVEKLLIDLYRQLAESTAVPRVQELFNGLLEQEENSVCKYALSLEELQGGEIEESPTAD